MIVFSAGIILLTNEQACLLHLAPDSEAWLTNILAKKVQSRRNALTVEWRPKLFADPSVTELPADDTALAEVILARDDYKTRLQKDATQDPPAITYNFSIADFESVSRVAGDATVTLFPSGINLTDTDANCVLAYVQDLENWVIGALMGQVNRGKKKMISQYHPIIMADPSVTTMPATEDGLITMILARDDYQRLGS